MRIMISILLIGLLFPCSCLEPPPPNEAYEDADVVLSGEVTNIVLDGNYYYAVTFQTIDIWKGEIGDEVVILTEAYSDMCGYNFQINNEYLVYAYNYNSGIYTNICTRTQLLEYASEDLEFLNSLKNGDINQDGFINISDVVITINIALGILPFNQLADINSDGLINVQDIILLVNIILNP